MKWIILSRNSENWAIIMSPTVDTSKILLILIISLYLSSTSSSSRGLLCKPFLFFFRCFHLLLQLTFFLRFLFGCMRGRLRDLGRDFLCILIKLGQVELHPGERVGLNFLHKSLEWLYILLEHDEIVSAAVNACVFFDKGESSFDKVLIGLFEVGVGN